MGKLLTELNRTGHDCFGHRAVPWMCNLKYSEDGDPTIIPYVYKEAATYPPTSRDSRNKDGIIATLDKNITIEKKKKELQEAKALNVPKKPTSPAKKPKVMREPRPLPPMPDPREEVRPDVVTRPDPNAESNVLGGLVDSKSPATGPGPDTVLGPLGASGSTSRAPGPATPTPAPVEPATTTTPPVETAEPTPAPATKPEEPVSIRPTEVPPSQRQIASLGFRPQMTQSGLQFVGPPGDDGRSQTIYSAEEFEHEYGKYYAGQKIVENQRCDDSTYWGQLHATQDVGFDQNGKLVTYIKFRGPDGQIRQHLMDNTGSLVNPLNYSDGLLNWSPQEVQEGLAVAGWGKHPSGNYVNKYTGEILQREQYLLMAKSDQSIKVNQVQDNFRAHVVVTPQMRDQGVYSGIYLKPQQDPRTGSVTYIAYSTLLKDEKGNPLPIPLGEDYRHPLNLWIKQTRMDSDFGGDSLQAVANRFYDPTDPNNSSTIPVMTDSPVFQHLMEKHPELAVVPQSFMIDEHGRVECYYVNEKGQASHTRLPDTAAALIPVGERDYGYRPASQEECQRYGVPSGTLLHMTQDKFGNQSIEAINPSGRKYGVVSDSQSGDLGRKYYTDPTAPQDEPSSSSDKWSQVLKYVMLGLPVGLALGLVGWGATGGKGNLGAALLGGAGLGATLGGLGAYSGLLGGGQEEDDDDYYYGSAMNAGY